MRMPGLCDSCQTLDHLTYSPTFKLWLCHWCL